MGSWVLPIRYRSGLRRGSIDAKGIWDRLDKDIRLLHECVVGGRDGLYSEIRRKRLVGLDEGVMRELSRVVRSQRNMMSVLNRVWDLACDLREKLEVDSRVEARVVSMVGRVMGQELAKYRVVDVEKEAKRMRKDREQAEEEDSVFDEAEGDSIVKETAEEKAERIAKYQEFMRKSREIAERKKEGAKQETENTTE